MKKFFQQKKIDRQIPSRARGFTLIETLVAVSIFTVSILGLFAVLTEGISSTIYARQKIIASYLAQEGIEYIRNMRDTSVLYDSTSQQGWGNFKTKLIAGGACQGVNGCLFDDQRDEDGDPFSVFDLSSQPQPMTQIFLESCPSTCPSLLYDSVTGKYGYASGAVSGFSRKIWITITDSNPNEVRIFSKVEWTQGSGSYNITFSENLFNWVE